MAGRRFDGLMARVPPFVHDKTKDLLEELEPFYPDAKQGDLVGALLDAASAAKARAALASYYPKLNAARKEWNEGATDEEP